MGAKGIADLSGVAAYHSSRDVEIALMKGDHMDTVRALQSRRVRKAIRVYLKQIREHAAGFRRQVLYRIGVSEKPRDVTVDCVPRS